jgi:hypothetical protein
MTLNPAFLEGKRTVLRGSRNPETKIMRLGRNASDLVQNQLMIQGVSLGQRWVATTNDSVEVTIVTQSLTEAGFIIQVANEASGAKALVRPAEMGLHPQRTVLTQLFLPTRSIVALAIGTAISSAGIMAGLFGRVDLLQAVIVVAGGLTLVTSSVGFLALMLREREDTFLKELRG